MLNNRLAALSGMITRHYNHIWDCCCDHGHLGMALIQSGSATTVHFVDVVSPLIDVLTAKLEQQHPDSDCWETHYCDLNRLTLPDRHSEHLVIIAGVGGDLTIEFVKNMIANNPQHKIEFLLCPVRHNAKVRQALKDLGLKLFNESIVFDKGLFYEVIHASSKAQEEIAITGSLMWDNQNPKHLQYLEKTIEHYERAVRSSPEKYADLLSHYRELKTKLF